MPLWQILSTLKAYTIRLLGPFVKVFQLPSRYLVLFVEALSSCFEFGLRASGLDSTFGRSTRLRFGLKNKVSVLGALPNVAGT